MITAAPRARAPPLPAPNVRMPFRDRTPVPFFQVDDQLPTSRKHRALMELAVDDDGNGFSAIGMWMVAGADCQASGTDGHVKRTDLYRIVLNPVLADKWAAMLVDVGLWHRSGHDCPRCEPVAPGSHLFHDWFEMGYDKASQVRTTRGKRRELKDAKLIARVWARDCVDPSATPLVGLCRYCATELKRADRKSDKRWQMDHVDPTVTAGVRNVVLACHQCNQRKGNRTPAEAGMTLLPAPRAELTEDDSPSRHAAVTVSPEQSAAGTVSPAVNAAGISGAARTASPSDQPRNQTDPPPDKSPDPQTIAAVPARATRTGAGLAGSGQGQGLGRGLGEGHSTDPTTQRESPRKRRRRRSRGKPSPEQVLSPAGLSPGVHPSLDAGSAPDVEAPGRFGSPYAGWTGPPDSTNGETVCPTHGSHEPCRHCAKTAGDNQ